MQNHSHNIKRYRKDCTCPDLLLEDRAQSTLYLNGGICLQLEDISPVVSKNSDNYKMILLESLGARLWGLVTRHCKASSKLLIYIYFCK